ncbi:cytochrome P450 71B26 isoform X2 [Ziziphus jujuba]|uniref:Cytochrome P450 71B26 isoform X2 n=1 Tax=Ziziphus jujuba TaxID=326968 RepID=A0A6P6GJA6_ZIZJJ|nr:cytochrome P450 71B26 isoform X2 [Ziziphus jujuba]
MKNTDLQTSQISFNGTRCSKHVASFSTSISILFHKEVESRETKQQPPTWPSQASNHRKLAPAWYSATPIFMQACQNIWPCNASSTWRCPNSCNILCRGCKSRLKGFTPYGDYWREMRKICVLELFSAKRVQSYRSIREEEVDSLINLISESSSSATPVNLTEMLFSLTASIVFRIAFGTTFERSGFNNHRFHQVVHDVQAMLGSYSAAEFIPYVGWIVDRLSGLHQRFERTFNELDRFFQYVVDNHLSAERTKTDHEDIIDVLLKLVREQTGFGAAQLSQDNIKAVLLNVFLGGVDTGAITMIWAMAELAKQPKLMKKAQDEVRTSIGNKGRVSESDIDQLEYLKMIVKETFRLHPPAALLLPRETISHFKVNGFEVHPKTTIHINAWAIGRDPGYWKSPEEFIPERFVDSSTDFKGQHFELLPFGSGRRVCPGIYMATTMVELGLANLLYWFDWKLPDGMKEEDINMEEEAGISLTISKKIALNLVPAKYSGTHQKIA